MLIPTSQPRKWRRSQSVCQLARQIAAVAYETHLSCWSRQLERTSYRGVTGNPRCDAMRCDAPLFLCCRDETRAWGIECPDLVMSSHPIPSRHGYQKQSRIGARTAHTDTLSHRHPIVQRSSLTDGTPMACSPWSRHLIAKPAPSLRAGAWVRGWQVSRPASLPITMI